MAKPWFKDGVRFECQGTGQCCTSRGKYGYVYLTLVDRKRMAAVLDLTLREFTRQFCDVTDGWHHLKAPERDCQFLEGTRCAVYEGRPAQCRTWPFWPENMKAKTWTEDVAKFCPGVGKGRLYSEAEIRALLKEDPIDSQI